MTDAKRFDNEVTIKELDDLYGEGWTVRGDSTGTTGIEVKGTLISVSDALNAVEAMRAGAAAALAQSKAGAK